MSIEEKRKQKKTAIMEAALEVWARDDYATTSLSALGEHLQITKQALYRYFRNKDELLDSMSEYVETLELDWFNKMTRKLYTLPQDERIRSFIESLSKAASTGSAQSRYIRFDSFNTLRRDKLSQRHLISRISGIREALDIPENILHLIMMFCLFLWGWHETRHIQKKRTNREKVDLIMEIIETGLATEHFALPVEESGLSISGEMESLRRKMHQNNLIQSVNMVIQERGFQGVTLEQIAEKAGISKSTLYNYFKNKDEMLTQTTNILVKEYIQYHSQLLSARDKFEDKLLVHLEMQYILFPKKPQAFIILKQFMSPGIFARVERPLLYPGFLDFLQKGLEEGKLKPLMTPHEYQMVFSFFIFIERVICKNEDEAHPTRNIIKWLRLLAYGFRAYEDETEGV